MPRPSLIRALAACSVVLAAGCGGDQLETVPVSGVVTCQGKPVPSARVMFSPQAIEGREASDLGKPGIGTTDDQGRFTLSTYSDGDGVVVGRHAVSVNLVYNEDTATGPDPNDKFPCAGKTKEIVVDQGSGEVKVDL